MGLEKLDTFNVPRDLLENIQDVVGRSSQVTMASMVQYEVKPERMESRVLVLTEYRVLVMTCKLPSKVELSIPFINIHSIESKTSSKLIISLEGRRLNFSIPDETKIDKLILHIVESLSLAFPKVQTDQLIGQIEVAPPGRQFFQDLRDVKGKQEKREPGPCGGFSSSYKYMCDYHGLPQMADVIWDLDTIYMSQDSRELRLSDFDHLDTRYLIPIVTALEYNHWFTSLVASNLRLHPEVINSIPTVMRKNSTIEQLHLSNIGLKSEFIQRLAVNVASNPSTSLVHIDLSSNPLDDRGISNLTHCLSRLPKGLMHLNLSQTGMTFKGVNRLAESLCANTQIADTLRVLNLSRNSIRGEDITNLFNFLAQPNALTTLNLSATDCALDSIFGALLRGSCQNLVHLDLSHNPFLSKKMTTVQPSCKQFFGSVLSLKHVNLSSCRIPAEAIKFLLLGLGSNPIATDIEVNLSGNNLGQDLQTLEMCLPDISNITTLDLSDNGLDVALLGLIPKLAKNQSIKKLLIGKNFSNIKARNLGQILEFLTEMIHEENSVLESLSLAGSKLRGHTSIFINALGGNSSLKEVDISGNGMGDSGARMLSKALQINNTLHTLHWDGNGTSPQGFTDMAEALEKNYSLKKMPLPLHDITTAMRSNPEKTETALQKIEFILQRNHSPRKFASDQGYRLQQGFLINTLQQMLDRSIVTLQATAKKLEDKHDGSEDVVEDLSTANCLIKDAGSSRQLLAKFQDIALKTETEESTIYDELMEISKNIQASLVEQVTDNLSAMLVCATTECPTLMEDEDLQSEVESSCKERAVVPKHFTKGLVVDQLGADVFNKLGELNLAVATHMSDQLIEGVLNALNTNHDKLLAHLRVLRRSDPDESEHSERKPSLLRDKSAADDKLAPLQDVSATKRKSVYSRKVRPQSSVGSPRMEPKVMRPGHSPGGAPSQDKTDGKDGEENDSSPVPAPRKRKSMLKSALSVESTPGTPPLPIVHEKGASKKPESGSTPKSSQKGQSGVVSPTSAESILHDLDILSRKHAYQKEYLKQESVTGYTPIAETRKCASFSDRVDIPLNIVRGHRVRFGSDDQAGSPLTGVGAFDLCTYSSSPTDGEVFDTKSPHGGVDKSYKEGTSILRKRPDTQGDKLLPNHGEELRSAKAPVPKPRPSLPDRTSKSVEMMKEEIRLNRSAQERELTEKTSSSPAGQKPSQNASQNGTSATGPHDGGKGSPKTSAKSKIGQKWVALKTAVHLTKPAKDKKSEAPGIPSSRKGDSRGQETSTARTAGFVTVDEDDDDENDEEDDDDEEEEDPKSVGTISLTGSTDLTDSSTNSPFNSRESTPSRESPVHKVQKAKSQEKLRTGDLSVTIDSSAPKLEHLGRARPKPPRTRAITRVGVRSEMVVTDSSSVGSDDLGNFFDTKPVSKELVSPTGSNKVLSPPTTKKETSKEKKGWSPKGLFSSAKRSQSTRSPEPSSTKQASPVKRLPEVRESPEVKDTKAEVKRAQSSDDELEKNNKSEDEKEVPAEEPEEPKKRVPLVPRIGPGGNAMMAELMAKRVSMNPLASKNKPPTDEAPKDSPPASANTARMPPGGRPLFPPGGAPGLKHAPSVNRSSSPSSGSQAAEEVKTKPVAPLRPKPPLVPPKPIKSRNSVSPNRASKVSEVSRATTSATSTTPTSTTSSAETGAKTTPSSAKPEAVEESDKSPPRTPSESTPEAQAIKKRLSVREKAAALDKNRNEWDSISRSNKAGGDTPARSSRGSTEGRSSKTSTDGGDGGEISSNDKGGSKSPGPETQSNGSAKDGTKEEFLMYL